MPPWRGASSCLKTCGWIPRWICSCLPVYPLEFVNGTQVGIAHRPHLPADLLHPLLGFGAAFQLLPLPLGGAAAQLIAFPELIYQLLFLHIGGKLPLAHLGKLPLQFVDAAVALLGSTSPFLSMMKTPSSCENSFTLSQLTRSFMSRTSAGCPAYGFKTP